MSRTQAMLLFALAVVVIGSAVSVVYAKYSSRVLFVKLQSLAREADEIDIDWGKLQLELSTWGTHARVERLARDELRMRLPKPEEIIVIRQKDGR